MSLLTDDLKWALRSLAKSPGFTLLAVAILALGIGVNAGIFSLVDRVLLQPLPYPNSERLVAVWESMPEKNWLREPFSAKDLDDWRQASTQLDGLVGLASTTLNLTGGTEPERVRAGRVGANFFALVGVAPALGRGFLPGEDQPGAGRVAVLTYDFWQRHGMGDPAMVGRSLHLDGQDWLVVGVMPRGFHFDHQVNQSDIYIPLVVGAFQANQRGAHFMPALGRLKPGASVASAQAELVAVARRLELAYPDSNRGMTARVIPLRDELVRNSRSTLLVLLGAVALVLLIACANVMNLMLARGARRERETAIRAALGATRWRLIRQGLTESAVLGALGGLLGLLLARWTLAGFQSGLGVQAGIDGVQLQPRVLGFTFALALVTALLAGLMPALHYQDSDLGSALKEGAKGTGGRAQHHLRGLLVALEMAMATALLIGSGLMLRSLQHLHTVDPGFRSDHLLTARVTLPPFKYANSEAQIAFTRGLLRRVAELPGVQAVGGNDTLPLAGSTSSLTYTVSGMTLADPDSLIHQVSPGYFRAMGIPLLRGVDFGDASEHSCIINDQFARRHWPDGNPLGQRISVDGPGGPWRTIVGVVGSVRHQSLTLPLEPELYFSMFDPNPESLPLSHYVLAIRTSGDPESYRQAVRAVLRACDPDLPLGQTLTMDQTRALGERTTRTGGLLLTSFALLALALAAAGIYGVISFITGGRTREIGVRMALGARMLDVLRLILGQGLRMVLLGLALGLVVALGLGRFLETVMVGVRPWDPVTLIGAALLLLIVGSLACLIPAFRAARIHPSEALRHD